MCRLCDYSVALFMPTMRSHTMIFIHGHHGKDEAADAPWKLASRGKTPQPWHSTSFETPLTRSSLGPRGR